MASRDELVEACVDMLDHAPLFSVLPRDDLLDLARKFHPIRVRKRETIFREGEPAERLFIVHTGRVKLTVSSAKGGELLVGVVSTGELFGELAVLDKGPRAMNAMAMEDGTVFSLAADTFWSIIESRPVVAHRLLELMARRLRRADQTAQDLVFDDAETRLARKLLQLAESHGQPTGHLDEKQLTVRVTQEELAQMIGVSRGRANRLIQSFAGRGWVDWNDGHPILRSPESLMRRAR